MQLNGLEIPAHYNGVGLHDTPGSGTAVWDYTQASSHARELRDHGVTLYKLFGDTSKVERGRAYVDQGILTAVRFWQDRPWGRGDYLWVTPSAQISMFVGAGVRLFELGWNEFNIAEEWAVPIPGPEAIAVEVVNAWETGLDRCAAVPGAIPLFPSNTPGGNVDHRRCYAAIIAELQRRGLLSTVKHIAVHPRPFNNPPSTVWSLTNTVTFDEWRWIRDQFAAAGVDAYYWATEHGYSLGDSQNGNFPPIDLGRWTAYNWELFVRMNPEHQTAIEGKLAGVTYWFNAGWGHWGPWPEDALVDSPAPEMPAPSPLWIQMGDSPQALAFSRYEEQPPPPPPGERAEGIDVSYWQATLDWPQLEDAGVSFVFIRTCRELTVDSRTFSHFDASGKTNILRGGYHYLQTTKPAVQARLFWSVLNDQNTQLPAVVDVEANDLNADIVRTFVETWYRLTDHPLLIYTSASKWHSLVGHGATWASEACDLWVAHWETDEPVLPDVWDSWLFWQYTSNGHLPGYIGRLDRDRFNGTVKELREKYGGEEPPPATPYRIEVEYRAGLTLITGNYPVAGVPLIVTNPWGYSVTVTTGSKPEWGPGGFEVYATPPGEEFTLYVEGYSYQVQTHQGLTVVRFIPV